MFIAVTIARVRARTLARCLLACTLMGSGMPAHAQTESQIYTLDAAASQLYWRVYSDGTLARLGHNHVIAAREFSGTVQLREPLALSSVELAIPVAALVVDDPALRAQLGDDFTSLPSERDIAGTRRNMLGARLLNAGEHPQLLISGAGPEGAPGNQQMALRITVAGRTVTQDVPVIVTIEGATVQARASFRLTHEALGLEPFSALLGALKVAQPLDFDMHLVARRQD